MWFVRYQIYGFDGEREAGPYNYAEAKYQLEDIIGYNDVHSAYLSHKA